jgi:hypothetical protein
MMTEHEKAVYDRLQEETNFDSGVIEIISVLVEHLIDRGAVDRAYLCRTLEAHIAVWTASTADRPNGRNPHRAEPLQILAELLSPPARSADDGVH